MKFVNYHHLEVLQKPAKPGFEQVKIPIRIRPYFLHCSSCGRIEACSISCGSIELSLRDYSAEETHEIGENNGCSLSNSYTAI